MKNGNLLLEGKEMLNLLTAAPAISNLRNLVVDPPLSLA